MRIILAILLSFACSAFAGGGVKKHSPRNRAALRKTALPAGDSGILRCARSLTGEDIVEQIASNPAFLALEKPTQTEGVRHVKLLIGYMADGSFEALYAPLSMGIFLGPALSKLEVHSLEKAVATNNNTLADAQERVIAIWLGEVEIRDGSIVRATYRDLHDRRNEVAVLDGFIKSEQFPWALPTTGTFKATKLRGNDFHLLPFMNLDTSREYGDFYESLGNSLSSVARSFNFVGQCLDRQDLECAHTYFKTTATQTKTELNGAILQFEMQAREDGFQYHGETDQTRFRKLVEKGSIDPTIATREDLEFFRRSIEQLSLFVNLSRRTLTLEDRQMFPLIYILDENGTGAVYPDYDEMARRANMP